MQDDAAWVRRVAGPCKPEPERVFTTGMEDRLVMLSDRSQEAVLPLTVEEKANIETVSAFIAAWNEKDGAKVMSFFAEDARFSVGQIGKTPEFRKPDFGAFIESASQVRITVTPGTVWARGPVVVHEQVDDIILPSRNITGKYMAVFTLKAGKIVDFLEFAV